MANNIQEQTQKPLKVREEKQFTDHQSTSLHIEGVKLHRGWACMYFWIGSSFMDASASSGKTEQQLPNWSATHYRMLVFVIVMFTISALLVNKSLALRDPRITSLPAVAVVVVVVGDETVIGWRICLQCKSSEKYASVWIYTGSLFHRVIFIICANYSHKKSVPGLVICLDFPTPQLFQLYLSAYFSRSRFENAHEPILRDFVIGNIWSVHLNVFFPRWQRLDVECEVGKRRAALNHRSLTQH